MMQQPQQRTRVPAIVLWSVPVPTALGGLGPASFHGQQPVVDGFYESCLPNAVFVSDALPAVRAGDIIVPVHDAAPDPSRASYASRVAVPGLYAAESVTPASGADAAGARVKAKLILDQGERVEWTGDRPGVMQLVSFTVDAYTRNQGLVRSWGTPDARNVAQVRWSDELLARKATCLVLQPSDFLPGPHGRECASILVRALDQAGLALGEALRMRLDAGCALAAAHRQGFHAFAA